MTSLGLQKEIVDGAVLDATIGRLREAGVILPTFAQLAQPDRIPEPIRAALAGVDPDTPHPLNLFRVHWYNAPDRRGTLSVPDHLVLPPALTGVPASIVVALGRNFPMIGAHKVLAAYGCLVPRLTTGQFDPTRHRAIWPSTGNYCRGGVAVSRILGCRGVAVLPEGMSRERFDWLDRWVADPADVIRTPGTESNVKAIYDACAELDRAPENVIFNQFAEFGNHLVHQHITGQALGQVFESFAASHPRARLAAFVSATGSAGTIAAGDHLKETHGARIVALEALECPTLLYNGFGEHNIQGIGDKHVPLIHNVTHTDLVAAVSDSASDGLGVLFNTDEGRAFLVERKGLAASLVERLGCMGLSGIANVLGAIKIAKYLELGPDQVILTVATDGFEMYGSEQAKTLSRRFAGGFDRVAAGETFGQHLAGAATDHVLELGHRDRDRIFNLGYFTWVEQQGVALADFQARRDQAFWRGLRDHLEAWDDLVDQVNARTGVEVA